MTACFVTLEAMHPQDTAATPDTLSALIGALSFALAIVINFAPGVTAGGARAAHTSRKISMETGAARSGVRRGSMRLKCGVSAWR